MASRSSEQVDRALAHTQGRRRLRSLFEYLGYLVVYWTGRLLPLPLASALFGKTARWIGPRARRSRAARAQMAMALPDTSPADRERWLADPWENAGRVMIEYGQIETLVAMPGGPRVEVEGIEHIRALAEDGRGGLIASAHYGSWQVMAQTLLHHGVRPLRFVYRPANNPYIRRHIRGFLDRSGVPMIEKSGAGAREIIEELRGGGHVILLTDQKSNDGVALPFFGRNAMTSPALAELALRYDLPLLPVRCLRARDGRGRLQTRFKVVAGPPLPLVHTGDKAADIAVGMAAVHAALERWIVEDPGQWLWLHKRWGAL